MSNRGQRFVRKPPLVSPGFGLPEVSCPARAMNINDPFVALDELPTRSMVKVDIRCLGLTIRVAPRLVLVGQWQIHGSCVVCVFSSLCSCTQSTPCYWMVLVARLLVEEINNIYSGYRTKKRRGCEIWLRLN